MNIEDEIIDELNQKERLIAHLGERTKKAEEDKLKEAKARKKAEEEIKRAEEEKKKMIELLRAAGITEDEIREKLNND
jgi:hypothetical protein